ncbi:hypothetical protein DPR00_25095 [Burkholderia pseudomallei]|nr:hypothetical protein DPR00_25095 [Burkholderia pseudomallei]
MLTFSYRLARLGDARPVQFAVPAHEFYRRRRAFRTELIESVARHARRASPAAKRQLHLFEPRAARVPRGRAS